MLSKKNLIFIGGMALAVWLGVSVLPKFMPFGQK